MNREPLNRRVLGEVLPISVGTALAFEENLLKGAINNHKHVYVNLHTLFRNLHGALQPEDRDMNLNPDLFIVGILEECTAIKEIVGRVTRGLGDVSFYCPTYDGLGKAFPRANLKTVNTEKQRKYAVLANTVLRVFINHQEHFLKKTGSKLLLTDYKLPTVPNLSVILTNHPVDLLSAKSDSLLLESHTGVLKPLSMWYTKLQGGKEFKRIPFNRLTLQVFGDGTDFGPMASKVRQAVLELAEERDWNPLTTTDRIKFSLGLMRDRFTAEVLKTML